MGEWQHSNVGSTIRIRRDDLSECHGSSRLPPICGEPTSCQDVLSMRGVQSGFTRLTA